MRAIPITAAVATIVVAAVAQTPQAPAPAPTPTTRGGPASTALNYVPGVGDLMNLLVQPRHAKLGLALEAGNWDLAAYMHKELTQAFNTVATVQPKYMKVTVAEAIQSMTGDAMRGLDDAIRARDPKRAAAAYSDLTDGCNSCHTALDHAFVVIKMPEASSFPDQEFKTP
ncbi:MAG TPA: cytochrome family protein [Xanthobacteraceae bacterium]|nr:cytochrome family protein [Xanthobacteraceae bacterium]